MDKKNLGPANCCTTSWFRLAIVYSSTATRCYSLCRLVVFVPNHQHHQHHERNCCRGTPNNDVPRYHRDELPTAPRASEEDVAAVGSLASTVRARWQNLVGQVWVVRRCRGRVSSRFGVSWYCCSAALQVNLLVLFCYFVLPSSDTYLQIRSRIN